MAKITDSLVSAFIDAMTTKEKKPPESYAYGIARNTGDKTIEVKLDGSDTWVEMKSAVKVKTYEKPGVYDKVSVMIKNRNGVITSNLSTPTLNSGLSNPISTIPSSSDDDDDDTLIATGDDDDETLPFNGSSGWLKRGKYAELFTDDDYTDIYVGKKDTTRLYVYSVQAMALNQISDRRMKTDIFDTDESNALGKVNQIKHRKFKWKSNGSEVALGYIAQEMGEIDPELEIDYGTCAVNMSYLIPLMSKAIQELSAEVEDLRKEVKRLGETQNRSVPADEE